MALDPTLTEALSALTAKLTVALGGDLDALLVYGSAAGGGYKPGKSNVNLLVVLRDATPVATTKAGEALADAGELVLAVHALSKEELAALAKTFPIQLLDMHWPK